MAAPSLSREELREVFNEVTDIGPPLVGGQAAVFPGMFNDQKIAIKVISTIIDNDGYGEESEEIADSEEFLRAKREIEVLAKIDNPHLVKLGPLEPRTFNHGNQSIFAFTLEWVDGCSLKQLWKKTPRAFTYNELVQLGREITIAIQCLSKEGILHRDITLGNVMRLHDNSFILLDMGFSFDFNSSSLSQAGAVVGTQGFIAPERLDVTRKRKLSFKSDCYSLGVLMYACATGTLPFSGFNSKKKALRDSLQKTPAPIKTFDENFPPKLEAFIMRLLAPAPHMRYPTIEEQLENLNSVLLSIGEPQN